MTRAVEDLAKLLDVMVGYDAEDPLTVRGVGQVPESYTNFLDKNGLQGARIGILREPMGYATDPESEDFRKIGEVFESAVDGLKSAGAEIVDPLVIPNLRALLAKRAGSLAIEQESFKTYFHRNRAAPYRVVKTR